MSFVSKKTKQKNKQKQTEFLCVCVWLYSAVLYLCLFAWEPNRWPAAQEAVDSNVTSN